MSPDGRSGPAVNVSSEAVNIQFKPSLIQELKVAAQRRSRTLSSFIFKAFKSQTSGLKREQRGLIAGMLEPRFPPRLLHVELAAVPLSLVTVTVPVPGTGPRSAQRRWD